MGLPTSGLFLASPGEHDRGQRHEAVAMSDQEAAIAAGRIKLAGQLAAGLNLALDFLPGSLTFSPAAGWLPPAEEAAAVVWLDTLVENVDRTPQNPNLLVWHRDLWAIDHGSALYFHHSWSTPERFSRQRYDASDHVLLGYAGGIARADEDLAPRVTPELLAEVVALVPEVWLASDTTYPSGEATRMAYVDHLLARLGRRPCWLPGASP